MAAGDVNGTQGKLKNVSTNDYTWVQPDLPGGSAFTDPGITLNTLPAAIEGMTGERLISNPIGNARSVETIITNLEQNPISNVSEMGIPIEPIVNLQPIQSLDTDSISLGSPDTPNVDTSSTPI